MIPAHPNCLIDGQIKVYTSNGWMKIRNIKIDDLVLTHKGRFRKVTRTYVTPKQMPEVVNFRLQSNRLTVTADHPVLINGKWIPAKDIKIGDTVKYLVNDDKQYGDYEFIEVEVMEVKKWELSKPRTLYNLAVEEDESYIANGFVIHNCRCAAIPILEEDIPEGTKIYE